MTRKRLWYSPVPMVGLRAVALKSRFGWRVVYRFNRGKCFSEFFFTLKGPFFYER